MNKIDNMQWMVDIPKYTQLQTNTLYYFEPPLSSDERLTLTESLDPHTHKWLQEWLMRVLGDVIYFVLDDEMEIAGWCDETPISEGVRNYPMYTPVNGRDYL